MKAIETLYKGYKFRSRLEARWAVFFDYMGIDWEYEKEGYTLSDGTRYLPDFWLPTFDGGMFVEVKGEITEEEKNKCRMLCEDSGRPVWMAVGIPDFKTYDVYYKHGDEIYFVDCSPNADQAIGDNRMYVSCEFASSDGIIPPEKFEFLAPQYEMAVYAARSARFEHGESGSTI